MTTQILKITHEEYEKIEAMNRSALLEGTRSMAHIKASLKHKWEGSKATRIGQAAHCALLEPQEFATRWGIKTMPWTTKAGKLQKEELEAKFGDCVLSSDEHDQVCQMVMQATTKDDAATAINSLIETDLVEQTIIWEECEVLCKARLDAVNLKHRCIVDYKTTEDASENAFTKSIGAWRYHQQAAFYLLAAQAAGWDVAHYVLIAQEKSSPYLCAIYRLDADSIERGTKMVKYLLGEVAYCKESNKWPGYGGNIKSISAPQWA